MALYKDSTNEFYVLSPGLRTFPSVAILNGNTGTFNSYWEMHETPNHIVNGMVWEDPTLQDAIVFSGYRIDYIFPYPALGSGYPLLFSVDISGTPSLQWEYLYPPFNAANYQNITFDYIVQPLHTVQANFINQYFYQPKSLVRGASSGWKGFQFAEPREDVPNRFDLNFLNTDLSGNVDPNCMETDEEHLFAIEGLQSYLNVAINAHIFSLSGSGAMVFPANVATYLTCEPPPAPKPSVGNNGTLGEMKIGIFPNPAKDVLYVSGLSGMNNAIIALFDMQGRLVLSQSYQGNETMLNISTLPNGVYFVQVSSMGKTVFVERVVKE